MISVFIRKDTQRHTEGRRLEVEEDVKTEVESEGMHLQAKEF